MLLAGGGSNRNPVKPQTSLKQQANPHRSARTSGILEGMRIVLAKDLGQRQYNEIADRLSMNARHLLWFLLEVAAEGTVQEAKLHARISRSGHDWTEEQLRSYLQELANVRCLTFWK